ncbi:MAG: hypothetical protein JWN61_2639 [Pseudonocardiales bacterium]|nr:hypothetical protein [Pseudonocardiales bacterium]
MIEYQRAEMASLAVIRAASVHGAARVSPLLTQRRVIDLGRRAAAGCPRR